MTFIPQPNINSPQFLYLTNQFTNLSLNNQNVQLSIENFKYLDDLGEGKHGSVQKVSYNNNIYALKIIPQNLFIKNNGEKNEEKEIDYLREVAVLKDLSKRDFKKVIKFVANFEDVKSRYILTDFVEGKSLDKLRKIHQENNLYIQQKNIINILMQLLEILKFLHDDCHIIHRDIKPENIILLNNGDIKLLDFGLAVYLQNVSNEKLISRRSFKGTRKYVPPEILYSKFRDYDYKVDIFCLGFTMYNLMNPDDINGETNLPLSTDKSNQRTENKNTNQFYDDWLMDFVKKLYTNDPESRPTAGAALEELKNKKNSPRRSQPCILIKTSQIPIETRFSANLDMMRNNVGMNINTDVNMNINKNFFRKETNIPIMYNEFLQPNQSKENKMITSMKSLIFILNKLDCMLFICCQMHSMFTNQNKNSNTFIKLYYQIFQDYQLMEKNLLLKENYERNINTFISEILKRNLTEISGPRPMILLFMMSSIIKQEFMTFNPNYENKILGGGLLNFDNYPFDALIPRNTYLPKCSYIIDEINRFKAGFKSPFVDNFYILQLSIEKCPQCGHIYNGEIIPCEFLQLKIVKEVDTIENLISNYFVENYPPTAYQCNDCDSSQIMSRQLFCLNSPDYLLLELDDKNKVIFKTKIFLPMFNGENICYEFIGAIYKTNYETHSEYFAVTKKGNNILVYNNDIIQEVYDINIINSEKPSLAFYKKLKK